MHGTRADDGSLGLRTDLGNAQDLYLAPRVRKNRLNIDPNSLLPKLPSPSELKPFPTVVQTIFRGHEGRVRSVAIDPVSAASKLPQVCGRSGGSRTLTALTLTATSSQC